MSGLLVIFPTFEAIDTVKKVFPSVLKEVEKTKSHLIVHDTSIKQKTEKSKYFHDLNQYLQQMSPLKNQIQNLLLFF